MSDAPADAPDRWTIRGVGDAERRDALAAAQRADISVGELLNRAIRAYVAAEREPVVGEVLAPGARHVLPALSLDDIARAVEIAARIAEIRGRPPQRLLGRAMRLLADRLGS